MNWKKIPSVTQGGKPNFYRLYDGERWLASIVWNREVRAYAVKVASDRVLEYVGTVAQGKRLVRMELGL